ncbi:hypothetical protein D3C73_969430 [compost metagenome]
MGFFEADFLAGIAQPVGVIKVNAGDDGAIGVDDVDRVQAAAQAHFQHDRIQARLRKQAQDGERGEFEVRQRDFTARRLDSLELGDQVAVRGNLAVDAGALIEIDQVRRRIQPHLVAGRQQNGFQHGTGGALAVGAAHDELHARQFKPHARGHFAHAVQAHVDRRGMDGFQVLQPIGQGGGGVRRTNGRHGGP